MGRNRCQRQSAARARPALRQLRVRPAGQGQQSQRRGRSAEHSETSCELRCGTHRPVARARVTARAWTGWQMAVRAERADMAQAEAREDEERKMTLALLSSTLLLLLCSLLLSYPLSFLYFLIVPWLHV